MRVVCAPDSFKESMTAVEAAAALARGVRAVHPSAEVVEVPLSDGGEGFVDALRTGLGGELRTTRVRGPLGAGVDANWLLAGDLAVIEVAQAVGIGLVPPESRDPRAAHTWGVGELLLSALEAGARRVIVGLGGSVTTDAGAGLLAALGVRFSDAAGARLTPAPRDLARLARVDLGGLDPRWAGVEVEAACDVTNPLTGPSGAAAVFGPQKGATPDDVAFLDGVLARVAALTPSARRDEAPGAGAAGGLGWALLAVLGARMRPGFDVVADTVGLSSALAGADLVLTGEGSVDAQTLSGKAPAGVARLAAEHGVPVVVFGGRVAPDAAALLGDRVAGLVEITPPGTPLADALRRGPANLEAACAAQLRRTASAAP